MRMSEKCRNNKHNNKNSDNPLTSRRTYGGKNTFFTIFTCGKCRWNKVISHGEDNEKVH